MTPCTSLFSHKTLDCWGPRSLVAPWVMCVDRIFWCITWRGGIRQVAPCNDQRVLLDTPGTSYAAMRPKPQGKPPA